MTPTPAPITIPRMPTSTQITLPPRLHRLLFFAYLLLMLASLASIAWFACHRAAAFPEFAQAGDSFGYLQAAQDIRTGHAPNNLPRFTFNAPHIELLHHFFQSQNTPPEKDAPLLAPNAYHLFPQTNLIVNQYPPGVPLLLALFPQGHALHSAHFLTATLLLLFALIVFLLLAKESRNGNLALKALAAALTALTVAISLLMFSISVSYAIDFLALPLLPLVPATHFSLTTTNKRISLPLAALLAVALFGYTVLSHITSILFLPAFLLLLNKTPKPTASTPWALATPTAQEKSPTHPIAAFVVPLIFIGGFVLTAVLPLAIHNTSLTGSPLRSTYTGIDTATPSLAVLPDNLAFYTTGLGSTYSLLTATALLAFYLLITSRLKSARPFLANTPLPNYLRAIPAFLLIPTAFFLTHPMATDYYQYPTLLTTLFATTFAVLSLALSKNPTPLFAEKPTLAAALLLGLTLPWYASVLPSVKDIGTVHVPILNDSTEKILHDPNAWIFADRFSGTLWYYRHIPATELLFSDPDTRWQALRFIAARNDPIYLLADNPGINPALADLQHRGATLTRVGAFAEQPILQLHMP